MADYETIQRRRNIIVGIFVLVAIFVLTWLIYQFGDLPTTISKLRSFEVFIQFPTAAGVQEDTPVRFCGYKIGQVTEVMAPEIRSDLNTGRRYHQTVVVLSIDKKYVDIPSNVDVKLMTRGLGSSYIELMVDISRLPAPPLDPNRPETRFLVKSMWLQGTTGVTSEFFPAESQEKLDELIDGLKALIDSTNDVIGDPNNKENLKKTLANLTEASEQATKTIEEFRQFAAAGTNTLKSADAKAEEIVTVMVSTSDELGKAASELRLILEKVNAGDGAAARFINDGRLYENLLENTQQLQMLLEELKLFIAKSSDKGFPIKLK